MSAVVTPAYEWSDLDWKAIERRVYKLQKRIYKASARGDVKAIHKLQRLLMTSWSARCLAVRRVTQDNRGKKTAGVDGVKSLPPHNRLRLVTILTLTTLPKPTRRVWIDKPGTTEKRGLGIPVMRDRATQALAKLALEPEWEARFEPNSYGFRPGRSCHDAIGAIFTSIRLKAKFVLDADLAKCFDRIDHQALLTKLQTYPTLRRAIKGWLKAGVMDGLDVTPTTRGTPQGGVASPLLANIALHGLETAIMASFPRYRMVNGTRERWQPQVIRYADDFVVLHQDKAVIERCQQVATEWLRGIGLELKPSKTRITHTLHPHEGNVGFDFLGFTVRQHPVGSGRAGTRTTGRVRGFKTIITPSKDAQRRHLAAIRRVVQKRKGATQAALISGLNPLIEGWCAYNARVVAKRTFSRMDAQTYAKLRRWAQRRHPTKPRTWVAEKYWHVSAGKWDFRVIDGPRLRKHSDTPIRRHAKVKGAKSVFDGDWAYWATRLGHHPDVPRKEAILLRQQGGTCAWCGLRFTSEDQREIDHILPVAADGQDVPQNRQLLHGHCHDAKTARDGSGAGRGTHDKS
ncbi:MAG: group II intron reverse transcriptase/maturase [Chloroflexota bacterium]|nr:group II intron reverse transcriptase/maturase [Chloroflexota bacterium]